VGGHQAICLDKEGKGSATRKERIARKRTVPVRTSKSPNSIICGKKDPDKDKEGERGRL